MTGRTLAEAILAETSGTDARAGDVVICDADLAYGTDGSTPMAIEYFERMGGERVAHPDRLWFVLDHYIPDAGSPTAALHARIRAFAQAHGIQVSEVAQGISHQVVVESGRVQPGHVIIGADSHTVTAGALGAFATGVGSSDLAAAMLCGQTWLRVPESLRVVLDGERSGGVSGKDIMLAIIAAIGPSRARYRALEFGGPAARTMALDDRLVLANMAVEIGAKVGLFAGDSGPQADADAVYTDTVTLDLARLTPLVALPHVPTNVAMLDSAAGMTVDMVFIGTCTGGRADDIRTALAVLERGGGIADGIRVVVTPASASVAAALGHDGTLDRLAELGATITSPGCGPCCGTSGPLPEPGMTVLSTANRNFRARMGTAAEIVLASPATCAASATRGRVVDPREVAT